MKKLFLLILAIPLQVFLYKSLGSSTFFIESLYLPFFEFYQTVVGGFFNIFPFSIGDLCYLFLGIILIRFFYIGIKALLKKQYAMVLLKTQKLLMGFNIFIWVYYLVWGWVYYASDLEQVYDVKNIQLAELQTLAQVYQNECILLRENLPQNKDGSLRLQKSDSQISNEITALYDHLPNEVLRLRKAHHTHVKKSLYSWILVYFGIGGYFNPFTQECQYISLMSDFKKPHTMAHEISHKWGFGKENEANFGAFLIGENSSDTHIAYSTKFNALRHLHRHIYLQDSQFVKEQRSLFSLSMKADVKADSLLQIKYASPLEHGFYGLNNAFLKFNEQEGSASYSRYISLVIGYERSKNKIP